MFKTFRPLKDTKVTQDFGENKACVNIGLDGVLRHPMKVVGTDPFGLCPSGHISLYKAFGHDGHNGVDMSSYHRQPVYHCAEWDGVMYTEKDGNGGLGVDVISDDRFPCTECGKSHHVKIRYWHLDEQIGHDGKVIKRGELIGRAGNTGLSTATHLHWAPKWCDNTGKSLHTDNGYGGAFAPPNYMNVFVVDAYDLQALQLTLKDKLTRMVFLLQLEVLKLQLLLAGK